MKSSFTAQIVLLIAMAGCAPSSSDHATKEKPAKVEPHPSEQDIYRVKLTEKAESRLQISTVAVRKQSVPRKRTLGGDILIPDGMRIPVTAPLAGKLLGIDEGVSLTAGRSVSSGQPLLKILPILRPELEVPGAAERVQMANARASLVTAQIQADGDFKQAKATVEAARIALDRARKLLSDGAGSQRSFDDAEAAYNIAIESLNAAKQRKDLLDKLTLEAEAGSAEAVVISAPSDGILQTITASAGQVVSTGAPLMEIVDLKKLWVRVPVYAGQLDEFDFGKPATLRPLSKRDVTETPLHRIEAPPTADPLTSTVDIYFELQNAEGSYMPGQRVTVDLPMKTDEESLVIPRAAVLRDIHGIGWVYIRSGEHQFERARVSVQFNTDELAVLRSGPDEGKEVVVDGAAELFGTEFGAGK
ncbi:efflux RND transporter periplasmic adaptor subunit [Stieleria sp. JC731]|uniref:efflux RND transporter periplasmic adaptor subunit n=1 Tax=Pirellulaceae TaxID=2691357 RepID=UPI001E37B74A|nr:efflux RND transporter periplasmic adaptor subunit [Stieleria sp. JC731]MCC9601930.1 efflux RND transporter periplasmic adaptor subunit [Stieleria sp. JC731]